MFRQIHVAWRGRVRVIRYWTVLYCPRPFGRSQGSTMDGGSCARAIKDVVPPCRCGGVPAGKEEAWWKRDGSEATPA